MSVGLQSPSTLAYLLEVVRVGLISLQTERPLRDVIATLQPTVHVTLSGGVKVSDGHVSNKSSSGQVLSDLNTQHTGQQPLYITMTPPNVQKILLLIGASSNIV